MCPRLCGANYDQRDTRGLPISKRRKTGVAHVDLRPVNEAACTTLRSRRAGKSQQLLTPNPAVFGHEFLEAEAVEMVKIHLCPLTGCTLVLIYPHGGDED